VEGDTRTAFHRFCRFCRFFIVGVLFLELNGYRLTASEEDPAKALLALAAGEIDESRFIQFLRASF